MQYELRSGLQLYSHLYSPLCRIDPSWTDLCSLGIPFASPRIPFSLFPSLSNHSHNAFVGQYDAGDIQYGRHVSMENNNLIYWKGTKVCVCVCVTDGSVCGGGESSDQPVD